MRFVNESSYSRAVPLACCLLCHIASTCELTLDAEIKRIIMIANVWHPLHFFNCLGDDVSVFHRYQR